MPATAAAFRVDLVGNTGFGGAARHNGQHQNRQDREPSGQLQQFFIKAIVLSGTPIRSFWSSVGLCQELAHQVIGDYRWRASPLPDFCRDRQRSLRRIVCLQEKHLDKRPPGKAFDPGGEE
jgi:hypothetical protein